MKCDRCGKEAGNIMYTHYGYKLCDTCTMRLQRITSDFVNKIDRDYPRKVLKTYLPDRNGNFRYDDRPDVTVVQCPRCKQRLRLTKKPDNYCSRCGQSLKWSDNLNGDEAIWEFIHNPCAGCCGECETCDVNKDVQKKIKESGE